MLQIDTKTIEKFKNYRLIFMLYADNFWNFFVLKGSKQKAKIRSYVVSCFDEKVPVFYLNFYFTLF